ncbi:phage tail sheath protein [Paenibacillus sp. 7124]|uniref:Phage tail sheath protein n=1 Tax=Paenibacillus apii TaxID=1850370 RepID=A0A6M1PG32_9BACL|nr:phage tail sheath C-terminal domain-containing protein [Paenibacillus apii]NGM81288.1 phage tail sheath protein [Paenibacillus apii]
MAIGLPNIEITFKALAASSVARSARGIVVLIVKDTTSTTFTVKEYKSITDIETNLFTASNVNYIKQVMAGGPNKVYVVRVGTSGTTAVADAVAALGSRKYNYIGFAEGTTTEQSDLATYVKSQESLNKTIKAIVYNVTAPDSQHVINFGNTNVTYADTGVTVTGEKYIAILLGLFAGLSLSRSATYLPLDLSAVTQPADLEAAIAAGKLVLFNDDGVVRIARAVNSLTSFGPTVPESCAKILVTEVMDLIRDDIFSTFKNDYIGKYKNKLDYQMLFIGAVNSYFRELANQDVLDNEYDNRAFIDVEAQRNAWLPSKPEAADWDETKVRSMPYQDNLYLAGQIKIADAMEDMTFAITME